MIANQARQEFPHGTGAGRSWINATEDDTDIAAYAGVIGPGGTTKGAMPDYLGMIQKGITPHKVSLKHYGLRRWFHYTFGEPEAKRSSRGFYRSVMVWKSTGTYKGFKRERTAEGKTAIPWLTRAVGKMLPSIEAELVALARKGPSNMAFQTGIGTVRA
jgi:hypothetical protein